MSYSECVGSLIYPDCNMHAPYCVVICGLSGCTIFFPHYLIKSAILGRNVIDVT
jgi:hypothetical protein